MTALWIVLAVAGYLAVAVGVGALWAAHIDDDDDHPMAYAFSLVWPIVLAPVLAFVITKRLGDRSRTEHIVEQRLARERAQRERRMQQLERELGIGEDR